MVRFKIYDGKQIKSNPILLTKFKLIFKSRDLPTDDIEELNKNSKIIFMYKDFKLLGFSWVVLPPDCVRANLRWFIVKDKTHTSSQSKELLDKTIEYCKTQNVAILELNYLPSTWKRIKDKVSLFNRFGYHADTEHTLCDLCFILDEKVFNDKKYKINAKDEEHENEFLKYLN